MILQILQRTPVWVWPLFATLLYVGYSQSKTRRVGRARLFALPAALLGLSLYSMFATFGANRIGFAAWLVGGVLALMLNRILQQPSGVAYAPDTRDFTLPGSWLPLILMMAIFAVRYAVAAAIAVDPSLRDAGSFAGIAGLAYGFLSGVFVARALHAGRVATQTRPMMPLRAV